MEKLKEKREQERLKRKELRLKIKKSIDDGSIEEPGDDLLNFKDSERESLISYFEKGNRIKMVDTPTRLVNESNEFLT
jgi:hypothetical protein